MKITFDGHYRDVIKVVSSQPEASLDPTKGFARSLADIAPKSLQVPETKEVIREPQSLVKSQDARIMARYDFSEPDLETPSLPDKTTSSLTPNAVKEMAPSVSPPLVVEARRVASTSKSAVRPGAPDIHALINTTGREIGVDPALSLAVAEAESSFNPKAVSSDGHASKGLFQLLDSTGKHLHSKLAVGGKYDPFNASMNTEIGVNYLRHLHEIFSNPTDLAHSLSTHPAANSSSLEKLAVAAFNAGEGRVASAQSRAKRAGIDPAEYSNVEPYLPDSTKEYVRRVIKFRDDHGGGTEG